MTENTTTPTQISSNEPELVEIKIKYWNQDDNLRKIIKKKVPGKTISGQSLLHLLEADNVPVEQHIVRYFNNADQGFEMLDREMEFPISEGQVFEFLLERIANSAPQPAVEQPIAPIKREDETTATTNPPIYLYPRDSPRPPAKEEQQLQKYGSNPNVSASPVRSRTPTTALSPTQDSYSARSFSMIHNQFNPYSTPTPPFQMTPTYSSQHQPIPVLGPQNVYSQYSMTPNGQNPYPPEKRLSMKSNVSKASSNNSSSGAENSNSVAHSSPSPSGSFQKASTETYERGTDMLNRKYRQVIEQEYGEVYTVKHDEQLTLNSLKPILQGRVLDIDLGYDHALARTEEGSVYSWGSGVKGKLGHGDTADRNTPCKIQSFKSSWKAKIIACGEKVSAAYGLNDHNQYELYVWGNPLNYQIPYPKLIELPSVDTEVAQLACTAQHLVLLSVSGEIFVWGVEQMHGWSQVPQFNSNIEAISCSKSHITILTEIGDVFVYPLDTTNTVSNQPVVVSLSTHMLGSNNNLVKQPYIMYKEPLKRIAQISTFGYNLLALDDNGNLYLRDLTTVNKMESEPFQLIWKGVQQKNIAQICCAGNKGYVLTRGGSLFSVEYDEEGALYGPKRLNVSRDRFIRKICAWKFGIVVLDSHWRNIFMRSMKALKSMDESREVYDAIQYVQALPTEKVLQFISPESYDQQDEGFALWDLLSFKKASNSVNFQIAISKQILDFNIQVEQCPILVNLKDTLIVNNLTSKDMKFVVELLQPQEELYTMTFIPASGVIPKKENVEITVNLEIKHPALLNEVIVIQLNDAAWYFSLVRLSTSNLFVNQIDFSQVSIDERNPIGIGASAVVYRGRWNDKWVAVKEYNANLFRMKFREFEREIATSRLHHKNILTVYGACAKHPNKIWLLTELMKCSLFDWLRDESNKLDNQTMIKFALDIAVGMEYLHSQGYIHRDLKSLNILISDDLVLKVADFGLARPVADTMTTQSGTLKWMAPEQLSKGNYTQKSDVYSYAMILYEIITRREPFEGLSLLFEIFREVVVEQKRPRLPSNTLPALRSLVEQCWHADPDYRPDFKTIVEKLEAIRDSLGGPKPSPPEAQPATVDPQPAAQ
eukprot:CAMPEP_0168578836 /NCGR_PEP_ID=MMETSP0413-20121227/21545_1 /TAXON_ID=136452 /ORGANISM="Filamoeba nolandi, Strain NC-AS-23-1" /LENGTH=1106 /DNA_ID=CAMNT_0008612709 /DNA_START=22 /DNA_END=3339 /DNA_ORIENTATION=+